MTPKGDNKESIQETRQRILDAAVEVGSRRGYARATTRLIAEHAGVNEVTLFRHFGTKQNLFSEAIERYGAPALVPTIESQLSGDFRQDLIVLGRTIFSVLLERREALQLILCESTHIPEVRGVMARNPQQLRVMLARYFKSQMDQGCMMEGHAELLAQAFLGMFFAYAISLNMLDSAIEPPVSNEDFVQCCVDLFMEGTIAGSAHMEGQ
jgi:AcrR family transcriptional regulator